MYRFVIAHVSVIIENHIVKNDICTFFSQNLSCGYKLESPRRYGFNESMIWIKNTKNYTPANPRFCCIKVGYKGIFCTRTCFRDVTFSSMSHQENMSVQ